MNTIKLEVGFRANGDYTSEVLTLSVGDSINCPFCHISIETQPLAYIYFADDNVQVFLKCKSCKSTFIGYTNKDQRLKTYSLQSLSVGKFKTSTSFEKEIIELSPKFIQIFGEAEAAEEYKLLEICGVGYRKALEFLVKDYLIKKNPLDEENVKQKLLGKCIQDHIESSKIQQIAEKAVWVGNDETHYVRKWGDKDLQDLKNLIKITIHYISMEIQATKYLTEMNREKL